MNKKYIIIGIIILLVVVGLYQILFNQKEAEFEQVEVKRGEVSQAVSETGQVQKGEKINLGFKNAGRIAGVYVVVGSRVGWGQTLATLDTSDLAISLQEAESALEIAQVDLAKLLAGATPEDIQVAQTKVDNKQTALDIAKQNLDDAYEDSLYILDDAYLKAYNAKKKVDVVQRDYFGGNDQESITVKSKKDKIEDAIESIKSYLDDAKADSSYSNIGLALAEAESKLSDISDALGAVRDMCDEASYRNTVSSTDKDALDTHRSNINTASTDIVNAKQAITSKDLAINTAEGNLQEAQDELASLLAPPREEDKSLYEAKVKQAQSQVDALENQVEETVLRSPAAGQIVEVKKRAGELVQPALQEAAIVLLPDDDYEIEVDIYEEDVVKVKIGNSVDISLVAFPEKAFGGKVISIDPAEKLVEGVVYYEVVIGFEEAPDDIRPGMTADISIKTALRENVLILPEDVIFERDGKNFVEVLINDKLTEKEVEIGLADDMVEIISGLEEGEKVILK